MSEEDRLIKELDEMEKNMTQTLSVLTGKIQKIQDLDSNLAELMKETNSEKISREKLSEIQKNQEKVMQSFDDLKTRLKNYKQMDENIASKAIHLQIFIHA